MSFNLDRFNIQPVPYLKLKREEAEYYIAYHKEKRQDRYLLKIYTVRDKISEQRINNEIYMNQQAQGVNQNIIKVKGVVKQQSIDDLTKQKQEKFIILLSYVSQNLREVIEFKKIAKENQYFTPQELKAQMKSLIKTFADLQRNNIAHRRIELESIYFLNQNSSFQLGDFYYSKNLIGQEDSEIRQIDQTELFQMKFPDEKSLECLSNGMPELKSNYYKMDVFSLGIVFLQLAQLEIYEGVFNFKQSKDFAIQKVGEIYGRNIKEFISLMLAPREERKDFIALEEIMNQILDQDNIDEQNIRCSIFPEDRNNLATIPENNSLREDFTSSSSNDTFKRDEDDSNQNILFDQSGSIPQRVLQDTYQENYRTQTMIDKNQIKQTNQTLPAEQNKDQNHTQKSKFLHQDYKMHQNFNLTSPTKLQLNRQNNQTSQSARSLQQNGFDQQLQIAIDESIPYSPQYPTIQQYIQNEYVQQQFPTQATQPMIQDNYSASYFMRSTQIKKQENLKYNDLVQKAQKQISLKWFDKKSIKIQNSIGRGQRSEVRGCETKERNCCIAKMYYKTKNTDVWEMLESLNKFYQCVQNKNILVIQIEGYYINPVKENEYESELWLIQKQKKYNLITIQLRHNLTFLERLSIVKKLILTITDIHNLNIAHGEIKPQNILLDLQKNPFLTDFVVCDKMIGPSQLIKSRGFETGYSAPEQYNDMQFCKNSDIWSLGVIISEFLTGLKVDSYIVEKFGLYDPTRQGSLDLQQYGYFDNYNISMLIKQMTQYNPDNRLPLNQVLEHINFLENTIKQDQGQYRLNRARQSVPQIPTYQQDPSPTRFQNCQLQICTQQQKQMQKKSAALRYKMYKV
ncbi:kinase domain protein (macronuclear) [Tetrahymena thermophila SB210]|uniref:Kinase domain protein n=1 Tax=Tetrahymena thermophila (strain SB210) TaxID=312017 RepID=I7MJ66_TETTS|nr:kinase domain protein [Tetrahymena thermophila SB210]EAS05153.2 kinase domain protein [Tetrahymena thermophila SB210]|eukprot:XP_001025398.2 kinase domain protein [Tetrahymena thermophila SB210]